jgi:hypothetical protein
MESKFQICGSCNLFKGIVLQEGYFSWPSHDTGILNKKSLHDSVYLCMCEPCGTLKESGRSMKEGETDFYTVKHIESGDKAQR